MPGDNPLTSNNKQNLECTTDARGRVELNRREVRKCQDWGYGKLAADSHSLEPIIDGLGGNHKVEWRAGTSYDRRKALVCDGMREETVVPAPVGPAILPSNPAPRLPQITAFWRRGCTQMVDRRDTPLRAILKTACDLRRFFRTKAQEGDLSL
jgi:hypothetical protein